MEIKNPPLADWRGWAYAKSLFAYAFHVAGPGQKNRMWEKAIIMVRVVVVVVVVIVVVVVVVIVLLVVE